MSRIKTAIIGTGGIANYHAQALLSLPEHVSLIAAVDLDQGRLTEFCNTHNIANRYTNSKEMLLQERPNIVFICTPPFTHYELILEALEAGSWVLCEKPLCASLAELAHIQIIEQRTGQYCSGVFQWRSGSHAGHLKQMMADNLLGRPLVSICQTTWYRNHAYYAVPWRGKWKTELGGPSMGHGIHAMDFLLHILGEWQEVNAMISTLDRNIEVEDVSLANVRFNDGHMASIINSVLSPHEESYLRFDFQKATVELRHLYHYTGKNWTMTLPKGDEIPSLLEKWNSLPDDRSADHTSMIKELIDHYQKGIPPSITSIEAGRVIELITAIYKSAYTGQTVKRGSITPGDPFYRHVGGPMALKEHPL